IFTGLATEQMTSYAGIDFAVNRGREFASHAGRPNRAVAIDEMQSCPHRCASRAQNFADELRFIGCAIGKLGPRINAEIEPGWIEGRRFKQLLREIVPGNTAVRRDVDVGRE